MGGRGREVERELTKQINFCWHGVGDATQVFGMHKQQPVSRTPWQTDGRTLGQTNRHFSIFYSRLGEGEEAKAGTTFATTCRDISLLLSCLCCALSLSISLFLSLCRTLAIFPALTISNLIRHFVEAANHPSEQIHQTKPAQPPWTTLAPLLCLHPLPPHARSNRHLVVSFARFLLHLPLPLLPALLPA